MKDDEKKNNIRKLFSEAEPSQKKAEKDNVININIKANGRGNIQAAGDITGDIHINSPTTIRLDFTPGPEHISPSQAKQIQDIVSNLAKKEVAGGMTERQARTKWYGALKGRAYRRGRFTASFLIILISEYHH